MNNELLDTIKKLSQSEGYKDVCHKQSKNDPMPSVDVLKEIVQLSRSILFPGYFGDAGVNNNTMLYHIGVNIDRLHLLLSQQIKAVCASIQVQMNRQPAMTLTVDRKTLPLHL
jgi:serine O-acetyltransferase